MENLLKFEKRAQTERKVLGTIAEVAGQGATINFIKHNFFSERRLHVVLKRPDETSASFNCSPAVSKGVRSKEITMSQLAGFPIVEHVVGDEYPNAGAVMAIISMPEGEGLLSAGEVPVVAEFVPDTFSIEDAVAF
jgi:hypothetical protein